MESLSCIDLFCGVGGLTYGLIAEGVPVKAGIDLDPTCRYPFEINNRAIFIKEDISNINARSIKDLFGKSDFRILAGCAPCQPFSTYSHRYDTLRSPNWALLYEFARLVKGVYPDIVTMENVPTVQTHLVYRDFLNTLKESGYSVWDHIIDCTDYGLPQRRRRLVLLASRLNPISLIEPTHYRPLTVRESIGHLPPIMAGGVHSSDPLHTASRLSMLNLERIKVSKPGGTWRDWPQYLVAECHRRKSGRTFPGVYGRMVWDEPAPTLTTQFYGFGNGRFGHPEQDRGLSLREGAILQGFPEHYSFLPENEPVHFKSLGRLIGNAVPVTLGRIIGRSIMRHLGIKDVAHTNQRRSKDAHCKTFVS